MRTLVIADRFERFHVANPLVYETLVRLSHEMHNKGMRKVSVDFIYQVARWEIIRATDDIEYKLNDHYRAFYARLIMAMEPALEGFFEVRTSEADQWMINPTSELMRQWVSQRLRS